MSAAAEQTEPRRPSANERTYEVAMAALTRAPSPPEHTVGLTLNAKGDVQIEVTGRGHDLTGLAESVSATFEGLRERFRPAVAVAENGGQDAS